MCDICLLMNDDDMELEFVKILFRLDCHFVIFGMIPCKNFSETLWKILVFLQCVKCSFQCIECIEENGTQIYC